MKTFLLDIWHDLREKRLWPVALALVLGLVAVPVLLAKPAEEPSPPPVANTAPTPKEDDELAAIANVELGDQDGAGSGSTLGVFDPNDPFKPPSKVVKDSESESSGSGAGPRSETVEVSPDGKVTVEEDFGGRSSGGSKGGNSGGDTGKGGDKGDGGGTKTVTTTYQYVVDVTFSTNRRVRRVKGLEKLDMLPNEAAPMLIFMGVTEGGGSAVFMVDSTLEAAGEGVCKPSADECAFVYIGPGSEHVFTHEDGRTYTLRIDEIRRVKVKPAARTAKAGSRRANASVGAPRRFVPPVLVDVVVSRERVDDSDSSRDGR